MTKGGKPAGEGQQRNPKYVIILKIDAKPQSGQYNNLRDRAASWGTFSSIRYQGKTYGRGHLFFFNNRAIFEMVKITLVGDEHVIGSSHINNVGYIDLNRL